MKISPKRILDFLAVVRHGSFSAAAQATRISQPGLSQSIAQLEHALDARILDRDRHGARPTALGNALLYHAESLESLLERTALDMDLRIQGLQGHLAIGITPIVSTNIVPEALSTLLDETPDISVSVTDGLDDDILDMLRSLKLDIVVCRLNSENWGKDLAAEPLFTSDWAVIVRPGHPLANRESVSLKDLGQEHWVLPAMGSAFRHQMELAFKAADVAWPQTNISTNSILAIKYFIMNTSYVTIMSPQLVSMECSVGRLHAIPLTDMDPLGPVGMIWRRDQELSPIAARFARTLRFTAAGYSQL